MGLAMKRGYCFILIIGISLCLGIICFRFGGRMMSGVGRIVRIIGRGLVTFCLLLSLLSYAALRSGNIIQYFCDCVPFYPCRYLQL